MSLRFFPPLGLLSALGGAGTAAFWLLQSDPFPGPSASISSEPGTVVSNGSDYYRLPEPFDADEAIRQFASRPLLAEGRKSFVLAPVEQPAEVTPPPEPPPEPAVAAVVETLPPPQIRLMGVMESEGLRRALVADETTGEQKWLAKGEDVQGWTLTEINDEQIHLQGEDVEITFNLFE